MDIMWELRVAGELAFAMLLAGIIGLERETAHKPAGVRTHMLVAGAAALLVGLGHALVTAFAAHAPNPDSPLRLQTDPIRIVEAIVTGVSFLGAGTIIRRARQDTVEGLTTAASLLLCAAVGIAVGVGRFVLAALATTAALLVLRGVKKIEIWVQQRRRKEEADDAGLNDE